jgi:hypothetical protein
VKTAVSKAKFVSRSAIMAKPGTQTTVADTNEVDITAFINGMIKAELHVHLENVTSIYAMIVMGSC